MKKALYIASLGLVTLFAGCKPAAEATTAGLADNTQSETVVAPPAAAKAAAVVCPSKELKAFVDAFAEDEALQRAFTANVVQAAYVDWKAEPEPAQVSKSLARESLTFPVMPNSMQQKKEGLAYREISNDGSKAKIALGLPDTDAQIKYSFEYSDCWRLVSIVDPKFTKEIDGINPELSTFISSGQVIREQYVADLDNDGDDDLLLVAESPFVQDEKYASQDKNRHEPRTIMLLRRNKTGSFELAASNNKLVPCKACGGTMGDPLSKISAEEGKFKVLLEGGSRELWSREYQFDYEASSNSWVLSKVDEGMADRLTNDASSGVRTAADFGVVTLEQFDPEKIVMN